MKKIFILSFSADTARINVPKINRYAIIDMAEQGLEKRPMSATVLDNSKIHLPQKIYRDRYVKK